MMRALTVLLLGASVAVAGCATPMAMRDIQAIKPNCARIDRQIAALEHEKAENDQRLIAGIQSVVAGARGAEPRAGHLWPECLHRHGRVGRAIDRKLAELRRAKRSC